MVEEGAHDIGDELLAEWRTALLWAEVPDRALELRQGSAGAGEPFPSGLVAVHFVTAWNPDARQVAAEENARRQADLLAALDGGGVEHWRAAGYATDLSWIEEGFALASCGSEAACELGLRFGQLAVYRWTAERVESLDCTSGSVLTSEPWTAAARSSPPRAQ